MAGIANLFAKIGAKTDDFKKGVKDVKGEADGLKDYFKGVGGAIAGAFALNSIKDFALETINIARVSEGVEQAFKRIGDESMLEGLRRSTKGTVNDLELMKAAVQANNFGIPLKSLGSLLEFAHQRAKDTGQSVDYLVQSIVLGIGRKSPLILDNLGISAVQLREKFKGLNAEQQSVGDLAKAVGEISSEAMAKITSSVETANEKMKRISAWWDNYKQKIGEGLTSIIGAVIDLGAKAGNAVDRLFSSDRLTAWEKFWRTTSVLTGSKRKEWDEYTEAIRQSEDRHEKLATTMADLYKKRLSDKVATMNQTSASMMLINQQEILLYELSQLEKQKEQDGKLTAAASYLYKKYTKELEVTNQMYKNLAQSSAKLAGTPPITIGLLEAAEKKVKDLYESYNKATTLGLAEQIRQQTIVAEKELENLRKKLAETRNINEGTANVPSKLTPIAAGTLDSGISLPTAQEMSDRLNPAADAYSAFGDNMMQINESINQGMSEFIGTFAEHIGAIAVGVEGIGDLGAALLGMIADFMGSLGKQLIALGTAGIAAQLLIKNPYTALAAGIALVALSGAAKAAMGGGPFGGGGGGSSPTVSRSTYSGLSGSNDLTVQIEGVVRGEDIFFSQKNYNKKMNNSISR